MTRGKFIRRIGSMSAVLVCSLLLICGCDGGETAKGTDDDVKQAGTETVVQKPDDEKTEDPTQREELSEHLESLVGSWELIATVYDNNCEMVDTIGFNGSLDIFREEEKYILDYYQDAYGTTMIYGLELEEVKTPSFEGNDKAEWYAESHRRRPEGVTYSIARLSGDVLKLQIHNIETYEDEETGTLEKYEYDSYYIYVRADSPNKQDVIFSYRYQSTVTVSNIRELYEALDSNTRIILKEGEYNISQLPVSDRRNKKLNYYYGEAGNREEIQSDTIRLVCLHNVMLEGEEGAKAVICTEDGAEPVLSFEGCQNITLQNITLGHEVEPGYCAGAVIDLNGCDKVNLDKCNLYGSGAYGIQGYGSYEVKVTDCDIYECTYGLIDFVNSGYLTFSDCKLRDSSRFTMLDLDGCWEVLFENCSITDNTVRWADEPFINAGDAAVTFRDCTFSGNSYQVFSAGKVITEKCVISDN